MQSRQDVDKFGKSLWAYSTLFGLGHSEARLAELLAQIASALDGLARLREIELAGVDMAVTFVADAV